MKKRLLSILLCALFIFSYLPTALADNDTTPPDLVSVSINKTEFLAGETVTITVKATDALSGIANGRLVFARGNRGAEVTLTQQNEDTLTGELILDKNTYQTGNYQLSLICLYDKSGNQIYYIADNPWNGARLLPPEMVINFHVTNNERTDWEGPVLYSLTADKTVATAGDTINFEAVASDPSGFEQLSAGLVGPKSLSIHLTPVEGDPNKLRGSVKIPATYPSGTYICDGCIIIDRLGNPSFYSSHPTTEYEKKTPNEAMVSIVVNGTQQITSNVSVTDVQMTPSAVKQGEPINFRITLNDGGNHIDGFMLAITPRVWAASQTQQIGCFMTKVSDSVYECSILPPVNWPTGEYVICELMWTEESTGSYADWKGNRYPNYNSNNPYISFNVTSVYSGTQNTRLMVNSPAFDPMAGVTAANNSEGDMTEKIEVIGSVDTSKTGVYLLKYKIPSMYNDSYTSQNLYYYDFRWIGVTEIMPTGNSADTPLALTNDSLTVGASQSDVFISRNGNSISYSSVVTDPGVYTLTSNENASAAGTSSTASFSPDMAAITAASSKNATAIIDRSGPALSATWIRTGSSYVVTVNASDPSGITDIKYKAGDCSLSDTKAGGTPFNGSFTVPSPGKYTVYARDGFGYESLSVYYVTSPVTSPVTPPFISPVTPPFISPVPSPYLFGMDISVGTLSRGFSKAVYSYKITLGEDQPSLTLTPTKEYDGAIMTINGKAVPSYNINLANGKSAKVSVKVKHGKMAKTYTFSISRAKSTNSKLSALTASAGLFNTAFSPDITNYTLMLDENTASTMIKASSMVPLAKVSPASSKITLKNGQSKTLKFTVKAQSGAKKTYTVTVTRAPSTNANLKLLKTSMPLSPGFNTDISNYTVTLPAEKGAVMISAVAIDKLSKVTINGLKKSAQKVTLANGQSITVTVVVTAQSGVTKAYTLTINRL